MPRSSKRQKTTGANVNFKEPAPKSRNPLALKRVDTPWAGVKTPKAKSKHTRGTPSSARAAPDPESEHDTDTDEDRDGAGGLQVRNHAFQFTSPEDRQRHLDGSDDDEAEDGDNEGLNFQDVDVPESDAEEHDNEPALKTPPPNTNRTVSKNGEDKFWLVLVRKMVADMSPQDKKPFILYLAVLPVNTGARTLIDSNLQLRQLAVTRGGMDAYSKAKAPLFNLHWRKAKAQLNRSIVLALTSDTSPFQMACNVMHGKAGPMRLHGDLSHLGDIETLVALLSSDGLYKDPKVHALWVGMFSSGMIYGSSKALPTLKLDEIVDVNYEAHARYEMVSRLSYQGFRHGSTAAELAERAVGFRKIRKLVRIDRLNNLKEAPPLPPLARHIMLQHVASCPVMLYYIMLHHVALCINFRACF
jgi:hypothetical protein